MDNAFAGKKILILGLGLNQGGLGVTRFLARCGASLRVSDLKSESELESTLSQLKDFPEIEYILGEHRYSDIDWADLIIKNPALKPDNPYIKYARDKGKKVEMEMGLFLDFIKTEQLIGITGTKGKSTTSSLIYEGLKANGQKAILAGNIGISVLDSLEEITPDTLVVLELSSFHLDSFADHQVSPKRAVVTNIYPEHLNYYQTMDEYVGAKRPIAEFQEEGDFLFLRKGDMVTNDSKFLEGLKAQIIYFQANDLPKGAVKLAGEHNLDNIAAALAVIESLGLDTGKAFAAMSQFKGVEFRLQLIKNTKGIKIYNDTTATNPSAAIASLKSFPGAILIAGGVSKNLPYGDLAKEIKNSAKAVYFLEGEASEIIKNHLKDLQAEDKIKGSYNDLEKMLDDIKAAAKPGDVILFSPGAASFNLFDNEFDRGRKFNKAVEKIFFK